LITNRDALAAGGLQSQQLLAQNQQLLVQSQQLLGEEDEQLKDSSWF